MSGHGKQHSLANSEDHADASQWTSLQTTVTASSANWESTYTSVNDTSANWDSAYTTISTTSASRVQSVKTTNTQDLNVAITSAVPITFDANDYISSDFTHTPATSGFTINTTGTYKVSYNVNVDKGTASNRPTLNCAVYVDDVINEATITKSYMRQSSNPDTGVTLPPFEISLTATNIVTIRGYNTQDSDTLDTILNQCWVRIERVT